MLTPYLSIPVWKKESFFTGCFYYNEWARFVFCCKADEFIIALLDHNQNEFTTVGIMLWTMTSAVIAIYVCAWALLAGTEPLPTAMQCAYSYDSLDVTYSGQRTNDNTA